jgi:hypothetical protein
MAEVPCPNCRSALKAPDGAAGRRATCKRCGHRFVAPGGDAPADPPHPFAFADPAIHLDRYDPDGRPRRRARRAGRKLPLVLALVGGALTFALGSAATAGYFLLVRDRPAAATAVSQARPPEAPRPAAESSGGHRPLAAGQREQTAVFSGHRPLTTDHRSPPPAVAIAPAPALPLPDPPTGPTGLIAKSKDRLALDCPAEAVRVVRFAHGNPPVVAVLWTSFAGFQGSGATDAVDLYSLTAGRRVERVEFPADGFAGPRLFELSPDGNRVAVEQPPGRLTVYDFEAKVKVLDGADPFAGADGPAGPLAAVRFVAPDRLAVFDRGGGLAVWDLKEKRRVLARPPVGPTDPPAAVSGVVGGRVLVAAAGSVTAVSLSTGKPDGPPVPLPDPRATPVAVAADALGKRAAVVCRQPGEAGFALAVLDLRGGGPAVHALLPAGAGPAAGVNFTGAETVVLVRTDGGAGGVLYDAEERVPVGYLRTASGPAAQFPDPSAGRHWWAVPDPADGKRAVLVAVEMPFEGYFGAAAKAAADRRPAFLVLRPDGLGK